MQWGSDEAAAGFEDDMRMGMHEDENARRLEDLIETHLGSAWTIDHPKQAAAEEARRRQLANDDDANARTVSQSLHFRQGLCIWNFSKSNFSERK